MNCVLISLEEVVIGLVILSSKRWSARFTRSIDIFNATKKGAIIMRTISTTIATGILAIFMSTQVLAADAGHTSEAMEHAGKAQAHGEMGHA